MLHRVLRSVPEPGAQLADTMQLPYLREFQQIVELWDSYQRAGLPVTEAMQHGVKQARAASNRLRCGAGEGMRSVHTAQHLHVRLPAAFDACMLYSVKNGNRNDGTAMLSSTVALHPCHSIVKSHSCSEDGCVMHCLHAGAPTKAALGICSSAATAFLWPRWQAGDVEAVT